MYHGDLDSLSSFRRNPRPPTNMNNTHEPEDSVSFVHCILKEGDTRVFIDAPNLHADRRHRTNCDGIVPSSQSLLVHSKNLFALGDSKFSQMLDNEVYQARVRRRRKPTDDMMKGVRYLLDLTPPSEGDELVFQVAELSLTPGVVNWWNSSSIHKIRRSLVEGHDDICPCRYDAHVEKLMEQEQEKEKEKEKEMEAITSSQSAAELLGTDQGGSSDQVVEAQPETEAMADKLREEAEEKITLPPTPIELLRLQAQGKREIFKTPRHYRIPDYCPFRHCNAIIRLLMMIEGKNVNFNSAARVCTMVGVSKIFECTSVVRDQVTQWIMTNSRFIEVLPEESLSIGFTLELPQVTQSAFRILVNELAIDEAGDKKMDRNRRITAFGRRRGDASDHTINLVQHAARALLERVNSQLNQLLNPELFDFWEMEDWSKLRKLEHLLMTEDDGTFGEALTQLKRLMAALVQKVTSKVKYIANGGDYCQNTYPEMDRDRATYVAPMDYEFIHDIIPTLNQSQRLMLPFFYSELGQECEKSLFFGQKSEQTGWKQQYFSHMIRDVETELQMLVDNNPELGRRTTWEFLFEPEPPNMPSKYLARTIWKPLIHIDILEFDVKRSLRPITRSWERTVANGFVPSLDITRHLLLTLSDNEMKFLPLWAGGNDDGSGGVFEEFLPPAEMGPIGPGPAYRTGMTVPSAPPSLSGSLMEEITAMKIQGSTAAGSVDVHDSVSTVYRPDKVIAADSSVATESFGEDNSDYGRAKFEVPAEHQATGQVVDMLIETPADDSDDALSDATEIGPYASDDDAGSDKEMTDDDKRSTSDSDAGSMVLV